MRRPPRTACKKPVILSPDAKKVIEEAAKNPIRVKPATEKSIPLTEFLKKRKKTS